MEFPPERLDTLLLILREEVNPERGDNDLKEKTFSLLGQNPKVQKGQCLVKVWSPGHSGVKRWPRT